ncbi:hypothetical protein [Rhizocola hellebori]|uniref:hypothetical protein n=1 Tax=Rhizocola hellebori TaxID=1392758 RepID=UPI001942C55F|nr:hypothetical protein [Rhizocola hellebori]
MRVVLATLVTLVAAVLVFGATQSDPADPVSRKDTCVALDAANQEALQEFVKAITSRGTINPVARAEQDAAKFKSITGRNSELKQPGEEYAAVFVKAAKDASVSSTGPAIFAATTITTSDAYHQLETMCAGYWPDRSAPV